MPMFNQFFSFTTAFQSDLAGPQVTVISPPQGATSIPTNVVVVINFDEPISPVGLTNGVQLSGPGGADRGFTRAVQWQPARHLYAITAIGGQCGARPGDQCDCVIWPAIR